ncbi:hypothetical protein DAPPUDRAFT_100775 [Daphnia pulex]|uniref:Uncharacterized protein n=1 Tax=Daphnia pulex TaxID=6669 RepID=E9GC41_DAPPU|nr:hypothetical protein DAPPUDRAFT_100775 [Daphnia pulex]|eukprot:EFX83207.1 hypothetical protein DAPPUDRAFT_100775 [Daphnia pulex]
MICASHVTDFKIDQPNPKNIPLMKHPESLRTTLVQIVNDAYDAFMKAHINMEKIQLQMAQVPDYVKDCVKMIKSDNKVEIEVLVPRRLKCIKKAANDGLKLSTEVAQAFDSLGQLIQQVLLAIAASQGAKEKEIEAAIKANIEERKRRQEESLEESIDRQKKYLQQEVEDNQQLKNRGQQYVMEEQKRSRDILERIFYPGEKEKKIKNFERSVEDAEKRLEKAKQDAKKADEEMGKIEKEFTESLKNMHIDKNWVGMTLYFQSINSYIEDMKTKQNTFVEDAEGAQDSSLIDFMADSIKNSLESSIKSHRTAATDVKVSNNYIMEPLRKMHGMLAIGPDEMEKAQKELIDSCKRASEGIKVMFNEDRTDYS